MYIKNEFDIFKNNHTDLVLFIFSDYSNQMKMRLTLLTLLFSIFGYAVFGQYGDPIIIQNTISGSDQDKYFFFDVDEDGIEDLIIAGHAITWYKHSDTPGQFWPMPPFSESQYLTQGIWHEDLDGDLDEDLLIYAADFSTSTGAIFWLENIDDVPHFAPQVLIADNIPIDDFDGVTFEDVNGDGFGDLISMPNWDVNLFSGAIAINLFDPSSPEPSFIGFEEINPAQPNITNYRFNNVVDFDQDGLMDLVTIARYSLQGDFFHGVVWFQNTGNPDMPFTDGITLLDDVDNNGMIWGDINQDNYPDMILNNHLNPDQIYVNDQNSGLVLGNTTPDFGAYTNLILKDIDGDSDLDLVQESFSSNTSMIRYARYNEQALTFESPVIIPPISAPFGGTSVKNGLFHDIDGDNQLDLIVNHFGSLFSGDRAFWLKNIDDFSDFQVQDFILLNTYNNSKLQFFDMDGDGDQDYFYGTWYDSELVIVECIEEGSVFAPPILLPIPDLDNCTLYQPGVKNWFPVDFDEDGDLDIVGGDQENILWLENLDGQGSFSDFQVIYELGTNCIPYWPLTMADMDLDGDLDFITRMTVNDVYILYKEDGVPAVSAPEYIHNGGNKMNRIKAGDMDGDGDMDLVTSRLGNGVTKISMSINPGPGGGQWAVQEIALPSKTLNNLVIVDLEGDEDLDIIAGYQYGDVQKFVNVNGDASEFAIVDIEADNIVYKQTFKDIDLNGFPDLVLLEQDGIKYYRNLYGIGFDESNPIYIGDYHEDMEFGGFHDINGDDDKEDFAIWKNGQISYFPQLGEFSLITGKVFYDLDQNGIFDGDDFALPDLKTTLSPANLCFFTNEDGNYNYPTMVDNHTVNVDIAPEWDITTSPYPIEIPDNPGTFDEQNIGLFPNALTYEATLELSTSPITCAGTSGIWMQVQNTGTAFADGVLSVELDPLVDFDSAIPLPDSIVNTTVYFSFESLPPQQKSVIKLRVANPDFNSTGATINYTATLSMLDEQGDEQYQTSADVSDIVSCSYDPNDKLRSPMRTGVDENHILPTDTLVYTIRFQNVGNAPAHTVRITDQLDPNLDFSTFQPLGASHDYDLTLRPDGGVQFLFKAIFLPDSTSNEPESHGFAKFQIQLKPDLPELTVIENKAEIYFDYNPAVITNLISDTLVFELPSEDLCIEFTELMIIENPELCPGESASLLIPDAQGIIDWYGIDNLGNTTLLNNQESTLIVEENSPYIFFFATGESDTCLVVSDTLEVKFQELTAPNIGANITGFCDGDSTLVFLIDTAGLAYWDWYLGDDLLPYSNEWTIYALEEGPYTIQTSYSQCPDYILTSDTVEFDVFPFEPAEIIFENGVLSLSEGTVWFWYLDDELIAGATDQTYTPTVSGWYTAYMIDTNGICGGYAIPIEVSVIDGVRKISNSETLKIWPNPTDGLLHLKTEVSQIETIRIWQADGKFSSTIREINSKQLTLEIDNYPRGVLLIEVSLQNGDILMKRIIKQ